MEPDGKVWAGGYFTSVHGVSRMRIALSELDGENFVGFDEEKCPGRNAAICSACQAVGFTPRIRHHVETLTALLAIVAAAKCVTLAPDEVSQLPHPGAVFVPLKPPVSSVRSVAALRKDDQKLLVRVLLDCCHGEGRTTGRQSAPSRKTRNP